MDGRRHKFKIFDQRINGINTIVPLKYAKHAISFLFLAHYLFAQTVFLENTDNLILPYYN